MSGRMIMVTSSCTNWTTTSPCQHKPEEAPTWSSAMSLKGGEEVLCFVSNRFVKCFGDKTTYHGFRQIGPRTVGPSCPGPNCPGPDCLGPNLPRTISCAFRNIARIVRLPWLEFEIRVLPYLFLFNFSWILPYSLMRAKWGCSDFLLFDLFVCDFSWILPYFLMRTERVCLQKEEGRHPATSYWNPNRLTWCGRDTVIGYLAFLLFLIFFIFIFILSYLY